MLYVVDLPPKIKNMLARLTPQAINAYFKTVFQRKPRLERLAMAIVWKPIPVRT